MSDREFSDLLDGAWPAVEPRAGFADRVLGRLAAPAVELRIVREAPPRSLRSTLVFAAVAVAALVIFPLAVHRHATPARAATVAVGVVPDLGLERD